MTLGLLLLAAMTQIQPSGSPVTAIPVSSTVPVVTAGYAPNGPGGAGIFLVVSLTYNTLTPQRIIHASLVNPAAGTVTAPHTIASTPIPVEHLSLSFNPTTQQFLLTALAIDPVAANASTVYGMVLSSAGAMVGGTAPFVIAQATGLVRMDGERAPMVVSACDGSGWMVAWSEFRRYAAGDSSVIRARPVLGTSVNSTPVFGGSVVSISPGAPEAGTLEFSPSLTRTEGTYRLAFASLVAGQSSAQVQPISSSGTAGSRVTLISLPSGAVVNSIRIAGSPARSQFLAAWVSTASGSQAITVRHSDAAGTALVSGSLAPAASMIVDPASLSLTQSPETGQYAVSWSEGVDPLTATGVRACSLRFARCIPGLNQIFTDSAAPLAINRRLLSPVPSVARTTGTEVFVGWADVLANILTVVKAQRYDLGPDPVMPRVSSIGQHSWEMTAIPRGAQICQAGFHVIADAYDPTSSGLRLEVNSRLEIPAGWGILPFRSDVLPASSPAAVWIPLIRHDSVDYDVTWEHRFVSEAGFASEWAPFTPGAVAPDFRVRHNTPPAITAIRLIEVPGGREIPIGGRCYGTGVRVEADFTDAENDAVRLHVEHRGPGEAFVTGTETSGEPMYGPTAVFEIPTEPGARRVRCRLSDPGLDDSPWEHVGVLESIVAFVQIPYGSSQKSSCFSSAGPGESVLLVLGILVLLRLLHSRQSSRR